MFQPLWLNSIGEDMRELVNKSRMYYADKYRYLNLKIICILLDCMNDPIEFSNDQAISLDIPESAKVCEDLLFPYLFLFGGVQLEDTDEISTLETFDRCVSQLNYCSDGVIEQYQLMPNKSELMVQACMILSMDPPEQHLEYRDFEILREELTIQLCEYLEEREETDATRDIWCVINFYGSSLCYSSKRMGYDLICSINVMSKIILEATRTLIRTMYHTDLTTTDQVRAFYDTEIKKIFNQ